MENPSTSKENPSTSRENPSLSNENPKKKGDINTVLNVLREIQKKVADLKPTGCDEEIAKFDELQKIVEKLASSSANNDSAEKSLPNTSKRRKHGKAANEKSNELDKDLVETKKQIDLLRKALAIFYDLEQKNFQYYARINKNETDNISKEIFIQRIMKNAESIPLFVKLDGEDIPPLCGSLRPGPNYVSKVGDLIAALPNNGAEEYILAEVVSYNASKKQYVVNDVYEQEPLISEHIIPLPKMRADPESCPEALFMKGQRVLALFPETSTFFPAIVQTQPFGSFDPYKLKFIDDNHATREAHQRYVIPLNAAR